MFFAQSITICFSDHVFLLFETYLGIILKGFIVAYNVFAILPQPLIDCFLSLRESGRVVMMTLSETWLRGYQVCAPVGFMF